MGSELNPGSGPHQLCNASEFLKRSKSGFSFVNGSTKTYL